MQFFKLFWGSRGSATGHSLITRSCYPAAPLAEIMAYVVHALTAPDCDGLRRSVPFLALATDGKNGDFTPSTRVPLQLTDQRPAGVHSRAVLYTSACDPAAWQCRCSRGAA